MPWISVVPICASFQIRRTARAITSLTTPFSRTAGFVQPSSEFWLPSAKSSLYVSATRAVVMLIDRTTLTRSSASSAKTKARRLFPRVPACGSASSPSPRRQPHFWPEHCHFGGLCRSVFSLPSALITGSPCSANSRNSPRYPSASKARINKFPKPPFLVFRRHHQPFRRFAESLLRLLPQC